ncbi:MAG: sodium/proton-translocating pyrophosphatase, partial [Clostridia bacterium]|nr:sodium/proton-translocating pyrophosphatase [Clostridia bacterium]
MEKLIYIIPAVAVLGLLFALALALRVKKQAPGNERMQEIAASIHEGATAFLFSEYKIIVVFIAVIFLAIGFGIGNWLEAVCFIVGAVFSIAAGFFGMQVATLANVRTANAAKEKGMAKALSVAFSGGAVMGLCVAGFGLLGISAIYAITKNADVLFGFSLGASSIALFARV